ncbi:MAG: GatB/YqeY domain-containing protein [Betaproteobacteria bacterium]|nr:GatB/YqeY domain-containing protein [Betaproteobacteria bacterium]
MPLKDQINDDLKNAMRAGDAKKRDAIRLLTAELKRKEVDERKTLTDAEVVSIIDKMIKQRRDSITQFEKGGREDLAANEKFEVGVLQAYMPQAMSEAQIADAVAASIAEAGAKGPADMGKVMNVLRPKLAGRADMGKVSALLKAKLSS